MISMLPDPIDRRNRSISTIELEFTTSRGKYTKKYNFVKIYSSILVEVRDGEWVNIEKLHEENAKVSEEYKKLNLESKE